jgi:hypothetical protein
MSPLQQLAYEHNCTKAITIKQPWAWLIIHGDKDIENRKWYTDHVGKVFIHASQSFDQDGFEYVQRKGLWQFNNSERFYKGGIVGIVELSGCTKFDPSEWFEGPYGFLLANPKPVKFTPCRGQLGIWDINHPDVNPFKRWRD